MLQRIKEDSHRSAQTSALLKATGEFRDPQSAPTLFSFLQEKSSRTDAFDALRSISGYDQPLIFNPEDQDPDERWLEKQHPRRDELLAQLIEALFELGDEGRLRRLLREATWAKGVEVDPALALLVNLRDDRCRQEALSALAWRLRRRGGQAEPLLKALEHNEPITRFLAAEGLALAGRAEGISVLLSAVELFERLPLRARAVKALGELGDPRALDLLLRLVGEQGQALQEQAAEAIGHLADGEQAETIFKILKRLSKENTGLAESALVGLRFFGTAEAWALIRTRLKGGSWRIRQQVCKLLAFDQDPLAKRLLEKIILEDSDSDVVGSASESLRDLWGWDSLEPDYIFLQSPSSGLEEETIPRLISRGDPERLISLLSKIEDRNQQKFSAPISEALLSWEPLPVRAALENLESPHDPTGALAARILGRQGAEPQGAEALERSLKACLERYIALQGLVDRGERSGADLKDLAERLSWLIWAAARLEGGDLLILQAAELGGRRVETRFVQEAAIHALAQGAGGEAALKLLSAAALGADAALRPLAAAALRQRAPQQAATLIEASLSDPQSLERLICDNEAPQVQQALRGAAAQLHVQGISLPQLVKRGDVEGLSAALSQLELPRATRLGALEALALIATEEACAPILALARREEEEKALRKAAWRALRRARRRQLKREVCL